METESRRVSVRKGGERERNEEVVGTEFHLRKMKNFWKWMVVMAAQQCECTYYHKNVQLK